MWKVWSGDFMQTKPNWKQTSTFSQLEYHLCSDIQSCTTSPKPDASCQNSPKDSLSQVGTKWHFVLEARTNMSLHVFEVTTNRVDDLIPFLVFLSD